MITTAQMYWIVILDNIMAAGIILLVIGTIGATFAAIGHACNDWAQWPSILFLCMALSGLTTLTFVPSTRQAAAIIVVPKLVNSEKVQTVGNHLYELAVEWMDELKPGKEAK